MMKKKKIVTQMLSLCLSVLTLAMIFVPAASAAVALPSVSSNSYIEVYSTLDEVPCYTDSSLSRRGTTSRAYATAHIDVGDLLKVLKIGDGWVYLRYPSGNTFSYAYCKTEHILGSRQATDYISSSNAKVTVYKNKDVKTSAGSVFVGDRVWIGGSTSSATIVIYDAVNSQGRAFKAGWVKNADVAKIKGTTSTASSNARVVLDVPCYRQNDARWANVYIGTKTIRQVGCLTTGLAMIHSYNTDRTIYPDVMRGVLKYNNNDVYWDSVIDLGYTHEAYNCRINQQMLAKIHSQLQAGNPVVIGGTGSGQHWVVIYGYTGIGSNYSANNFLIHDPGNGSRTTLNQFLSSYSTVKGLVY